MASVRIIKDRLLQVIGEDGSVLNLPVVMELIGLLEQISVTRDELEETRIGKYINDVRRAAKDVSLQKRAKKLIKSWQQMISSTVQTTKKPSINSPSINDSSFKRSRSSPTISNYLNHTKSSTSLNNMNGKATHSVVNSNKKEAYSEKNNLKKEATKPKPNVKMSHSKSAADLKTLHSTSDVANSSFTCKPNGLKIKFSNLHSTTSNQPSPTSSDEHKRLKRKRKEEVEVVKSNVSQRTSKIDYSNLSPKRTSIKKEDGILSKATPKKVHINHTATERTNVYKNSSPPGVAKNKIPPSVAKTFSKPLKQTPTPVYKPSREQMVKPGIIGNAILSSVTSRRYGDELAGVDGCRTNDGDWHPWADSFVVKRTVSFTPDTEPSEESEHLSILPYVELD